MERIIKSILLLSFIYSTMSTNYKLPSLNYSFSLGNNLVYNSNITSPIIKPYYYQQFSLNVNGWKTKRTYV